MVVISCIYTHAHVHYDNDVPGGEITTWRKIIVEIGAFGHFFLPKNNESIIQPPYCMQVNKIQRQAHSSFWIANNILQQGSYEIQNASLYDIGHFQ